MVKAIAACGSLCRCSASPRCCSCELACILLVLLSYTFARAIINAVPAYYFTCDLNFTSLSLLWVVVAVVIAVGNFDCPVVAAVLAVVVHSVLVAVMHFVLTCC